MTLGTSGTERRRAARVAATRSDSIAAAGSATTCYEMGPFRLDTRARVLTRDGVTQALGARGVEVLHALVARAGEHLSKAVLIDSAWPGLVIEESNLAVQVSAIRRVLGALPGAGGWIETVARRGYRFVGPVARRSMPDSSFPAVPGASLSLPADGFVGRARELDAIKQSLTAERALTLVGPGGVGKTRLALQAVAELVGAYRDGVFVVELGAIKDPLLVPAAVAQVLGVRERSDMPLIRGVCAHLGARKLLLLLDNCEHLLDACRTLVAAILCDCAGPTFLLTSREALQVHGEQTFTVSPLSLPDPDADHEAIASAEAVQLFIERARRAQPGFVFDGERASLVGDLCIQLDGMPLALELAAARMRTLSLEQVHGRLRDRFRLLTTASSVAVARQQTLRTTLDWSYDLLAEDERVVLRRLSIFPGSFTLEAASAVASDDAVDPNAVVDCVCQLISRSLAAESGFDAGRLRLLETTRAYAAEKLAEAGEVHSFRRSHAIWCSNLFATEPDDWMRMPDGEWRARYAFELDNVRVALDWALSEEGDQALGIALAGDSGGLWATWSLSREGVRRLRLALDWLPRLVISKDHEARLWLSLGLLEEASPGIAYGSLVAAEALYLTLDDCIALVDARRRRARALAQMGRYDEAARLLAETMPLAKQSGLPKLLGFHLHDRAFLKTLSGDPAGAMDDYMQSLALLQQAGAEHASVATMSSLADLKWAAADLDGALAVLREHTQVLRTSTTLRRSSLGFALFNLAGVHVERGDLPDALAAAREGLRLLGANGAWIFADHLAVHRALSGAVEKAAKLAGFADAAYLAKGAVRQPNESRARGRLQRLLNQGLSTEACERLRSAGAGLDDDDAWRLALED
jgi:predicted ATPase/DNA-binding winged helix-turn-helix (wHTH) protein